MAVGSIRKQVSSHNIMAGLEDLKPIPRDSDGNIIRDEYQELVWYSQQQLIKEVKRINGSVGRHEKAINILMNNVKVIRGVSAVLAGIFSYIKWLK